ncbi:MAG: LysR family transcriptional regulator [Solirubrobacteraceae bacterium]|nr:LysR family transcriptional regulator [Solirubrobacteraceae bacterium]
MDMPWPALRSLHEFARLGTIAAVAEARGYTPGAVSQQLATLERAVGQPLLDRVGRRLQLTDAGVVLVEHAERILRSEDAARHALEAVVGEVAGTIRLATFASSAATLLAPSIVAATARHPRLTALTIEVDVDAVTHVVERGDADLAFGLDYPDAPVPRAPGIDVLRVATERFGLAVPHAWRMPGAVSLADAAELDWILPPADTNYGRAVRAACRRAAFEPRVTHSVTDTAVSLAMVAQGLGITLVTDMMLALARPAGLRILRLREEVRRDVVLVRRRGDDARPAVAAMTAVIKEVVGAAVARTPATLDSRRS